jgi:transcriptional regulator with XRE-family HTH domain
MRGGELIREARTRAGLTQAELSERTGRDRSVIARWEQGLISPPVESLLACVHACGFDLPFVLVPLDESADRELHDSLMATPSERVGRMLEQLGQGRARRGAEGKIVANRASSFDPYELLSVLQARHVSFVVIGAFARVIHGTGEVTDGLDVTPSMREDNLARLQKALDDLEASRVNGKALDLASDHDPVIELNTGAGELKLVPEPAGSRGYDDLRRHASREPLGRGLRPQVASPGDLARMLGALDREDQVPVLLRLRRLMDLERDLGRSRGMGVEP